MAALTDRRFDGRCALSRFALGAALVGMIACVLGGARDPKQALFSYLTAFQYVLSLQLGALAFLMIAHLSRARWAIPLRRLNEAAAASVIVSPFLFLPILLQAGHVYEWVHAPQHRAVLAFLPSKSAYLDLPAFAIRAALYFALWIALAWQLRRASLAQDAGVATGYRPARFVSAAGVPLLGLTLTFAAFDWVMSLEPEWYSSMYGIYWFSGSYVAGIALLTVILRAAERSGWLQGLVHGSHYYALGRMLLAFTIFWAYIAYFQFFLIYIADRPEEVAYFVRRDTGSWRAFALALVIGHFAVPFMLLLQRALKFRPDLLAALAGWMLFVHYLDVYFLVMPVLHEHGFGPHWLDLAALLAVCGIALFTSLRLLRGHPVVPTNDPELAVGVAYRSW